MSYEYQHAYWERYKASGKAKERRRAYYEKHRAEILKKAKDRYKRKVLGDF